MSTDLLVQFCAPTLAGIKMGSLFTCAFTSLSDLKKTIHSRNQLLNPKGLYFLLLRHGNGRGLIFVYRKKMLEERLGQPNIQLFLGQYEYQDFSLQGALATLNAHLKTSEFPHEIGVFLGYPLSDIQGFIQHKGRNAKCVGVWTVYDDVEQAQKIFSMFRKCTQVYHRRAQEGYDISRLTTAC